MSFHETFSSLRNKIASKISDDSVNKFSNEVLRRMGMQVVSSQRIAERRQWQLEFNLAFKLRPPESFSPEAKFDFYVDQMDTIWGMYKANQMTWFRAASNGPFAQMVTDIEDMYEKTLIAIERNQHRLKTVNNFIEKLSDTKNDDKKTETQKENEKKRNDAIISKLKNKKEQQVRNFYIAWLVMYLFKYVGKQGNLCWCLEDVNPPETYGIQTVQPIQQDRAKVNEELLKGETDVSD